MGVELSGIGIGTRGSTIIGTGQAYGQAQRRPTSAGRESDTGTHHIKQGMMGGLVIDNQQREAHNHQPTSPEEESEAQAPRL